ncbi:melatonin receptor type 1B-like [Amphiura filiformis]|uniref:melatonin receptor type 1B-like n=1 Tax=Amphiura filiformis TaxID=82378 RepID=UPI003B222F21
MAIETEMNTTMTDTYDAVFIPVIWDWRNIIQLILAVVGILGNSVVIHVYRRNREMKHNTTNTFIAALAAADLITSISIIPHPRLSRVPQNGIGSFYCKVVWSSNIMWISIVASVITLTMLAVERYIAVAYSFRYKQIFTITKTRLIILGIWLFAFTLNTFGYYETFVVKEQCVHILPSIKFQMFLGCAVFIVEYLVPMIIMLVTNIRTIQLLNKQTRSFTRGKDATKGPALKLIQARRRVVNMLFIVIVTFIICWSPDQFAFLAFNLGWVPFEYAFGPLYRAFVVLAFANSCANPIIYTVMNRNFREAIAQQLPSMKCKSAEKGGTTNTLFETPLEDGDMKRADNGVVNAVGPSDSDEISPTTSGTKSSYLETIEADRDNGTTL